MKTVKKIVKITTLTLGILAVLYLGAFILRKISLVKEQTVIHTNHFKISYNGILKSEAESILRSLEENYTRIRTELNDPRHDTIVVFIHPTQNEFNSATGLINSKANGVSRGPKVFQLMYQTWYNSIFPAKMEKVAVHEFTHCVQLNILIEDAKTRYEDIDNTAFDKRFEREFAEKYPQWFWEALCDYEANIVNKSSVNYSIKKGLTLKDLNKSNQIYNLGHTIVDYMVTTFGKERLPDFIKSYGNFDKVYKISEQEFEQGWYKFVQAKY